MYELERALSSLFGMAAFSLNPAAGAHAELTALLVAKAYFTERGQSTSRTTVIVPDTAHGTNPASAAMVRLSKSSRCKATSAAASASTRFKKVLGDGYCRMHDDESEHARPL